METSSRTEHSRSCFEPSPQTARPKPPEVDSMSFAVGARLGSYEILSVVGTGGMGEVYKARDTRLNRVVALKILFESVTWSAENRRRLIREARTASALNHSNIVHIYDIGEQEGTQFLAMEYVEGTTLEKTIGPTGLRIQELLKYALEVSSALEAAHAAGVVHRDVKPANIMVTTDNVAKVVDFGVAKILDSDA